MQRLRDFFLKKTVRPYQGFILIAVGLIVIVVYQADFGPTELFRADNWAQVSISVGTSVLTLVAIIASIVLSNENNKRIEMTDSLTAISNQIDNKKRINPDRSLIATYEDAMNKLAQVIDQMSPLKYKVSLIGLFSFFLFLFSAVFAILGNPFKLVIGSFLIGVALLSGYVIYVIEEFLVMDKFSSPKEKKGKLILQDVKINGIHREFEQEKKEVSFTLTRKTERIEVKLRFNGTIRNGFLHATVIHSNGVAFIPDANTFLANFGFVDNYRLALREKEVDTGILQINGEHDFSFEIVLRSEKGTEENPIIDRVFIGMLGERELYKHCSIPDNIFVNCIELRIYEDPLYKPNFKRREVDCITLKVSEPEPRM